MQQYSIDTDNSIAYVYHAPTSQDNTFVFFNALTGDTSMWEGTIGESLRTAGYGTLSFNFRGQTGSAFGTEAVIDQSTIVADALALINHIQPQQAIYTGLSIGGLFATNLYLHPDLNSKPAGLVLINTLRKAGPKLDWINEAVFTAAKIGGTGLFRDLFAPLIFNPDWLVANRSACLQEDTYQPLSPSSGHYNLLEHSRSADWNIPYEELQLPVMVITGTLDRVFYDANDVDELYARLPDAQRFDIHNASHILPAERPTELTEQLLSFARGIQ